MEHVSIRQSGYEIVKLELTGYRIFRPKIIRMRDTPTRPPQWSAI